MVEVVFWLTMGGVSGALRVELNWSWVYQFMGNAIGLGVLFGTNDGAITEVLRLGEWSREVHQGAWGQVRALESDAPPPLQVREKTFCSFDGCLLWASGAIAE